MSEKITSDMTFAQALEIAGDDAATVMAKFGLHCIGCHVAGSETIEQGCSAHGLSSSDTENMIAEINEAVSKKE